MKETDRRAIDGSDQEQIAKLRSDQNELINAFRQKHGLEPDDVCVDVRRLPNNRLVWDVRKMSKAEREHRDQQQIARNIEAIRKSAERSYVYVLYQKEGFLNLIWANLKSWQRGSIFLTERGAEAACSKSEQVVKAEVRA